MEDLDNTISNHDKVKSKKISAKNAPYTKNINIKNKSSITLPVFHCYRCGHTWVPKIKNMKVSPPKVCPNPKCKSKNWNLKTAKDILE